MGYIDYIHQSIRLLVLGKMNFLSIKEQKNIFATNNQTKDSNSYIDHHIYI